MSDDRPVIVSQAEIEKRRCVSAWIRGSHNVDNLRANSETQHIFDDFVEGRIATNEEVNQLLHAHYSKIANLSKP